MPWYTEWWFQSLPITNTLDFKIYFLGICTIYRNNQNPLGNNGSFTENEFNKGIIWYWKIQSSELGDTNHSSIISCDFIRVIKKNYSYLKFSFNNFISSIMASVIKLWNQILVYFENAPLFPAWGKYHKKEKLCRMEYFYSTWSLVLTGVCFSYTFDSHWILFQVLRE